MCNENIRGLEHSYSIVNDAIHGVMSFPEKDKDLLKTLISSENFQRLRHIKQLGMAELIFPKPFIIALVIV